MAYSRCKCWSSQKLSYKVLCKVTNFKIDWKHYWKCTFRYSHMHHQMILGSHQDVCLNCFFVPNNIDPNYSLDKVWERENLMCNEFAGIWGHWGHCISNQEPPPSFFFNNNMHSPYYLASSSLDYASCVVFMHSISADSRHIENKIRQNKSAASLPQMGRRKTTPSLLTYLIVSFVLTDFVSSVDGWN